jgi:transcriptional regulator with XRE-family HTH domain
MSHRFFSAEMGLRLRELRGKAGLTQDQVADRMGLKGRHRKVIIMKLETGRVANPHLRTVARFLQVCGARWSRFTDLLERTEPKVRDAALIRDSGLPDETKRRLRAETSRQTGKYLRRMTYPAGDRPLHPRKLRAMTRGFADYRAAANLLELEATGFLRSQPVIAADYVKYKALCRRILSRVRTEARRRSPATELPTGEGKTMPGPADWQELGLDRKVAARLQKKIIARCRKLLRS